MTCHNEPMKSLLDDCISERKFHIALKALEGCKDSFSEYEKYKKQIELLFIEESARKIVKAE